MPAPIEESRILEAALAVWREDGYRAATTRKVAHRAGIGEVTLFRRFGDKVTLFSRALAQEARQMQDDALDYSGDLRLDLLAIVRAYTQMLDRNAAIVFDFLHSVPEESELTSVAHVPLAAMSRLAQIVARYQASGALREGNPFEVLLSLLGPILVRKLLSRAQPDLPLGGDFDASVDAFLSGYRA